MTLPLLSGFKHNHDTAAVLIDLEGAFDNVWREAVLYKLAKAGISGRLLLSISSFFRDRYCRCLVNTVRTDWQETSVGVPQGSVIAPILFIIAINDVSPHLGNHIKYADDITLWETSNCLHTAVANLEVKLQQLEKWCNTWRFSVNTSKTNVMCFSKRGHKDIAVHMGSHRLTQVNECRCLGVILDENLRFSSQVETAASKAMRALCKISALTSHTAGASMELMLLLYSACIRPHLEFAYPVWCTVRSISALERVQNLALRMATGTFVHCSSDAVEVMSHTLPLDIRLREILARTLCQYILSKEETDNFRVLVQSLLGDPAFSRGPRSTPLCLMTRALKDLNVSLQVNDPGSQPIEDMSDILSCRMEEDRIEWRNLGNSRDRSSEQKDQALKLATDFILSLNTDTIIFTDGSALSNPGPCGAGIVIYWTGLNCIPTCIGKPVARNSSSFHAEMVAIETAVEHVTLKKPALVDQVVHILTDCQSAVMAMTSSLHSSSFPEVVSRTNKNITLLRSRGTTVTITWIAGHANIMGNELADQLAKDAALEAASSSSLASAITLHKESAKTMRKNTEKLWQRRWDRSTKGRWTYQLQPTVARKSAHSSLPRSTEVKLMRMLTGHTKLNDNMHRIFPHNHPSPNCSCNRDRETIEHVLLHCSLYESSRLKMIQTIEIGYSKTNTPYHLREISVVTLLGFNPAMTKQMQSIIRASVVAFVSSTSANI
ncbi:uncharacterized protein LOC135153466 [Lytechinus pictus]|uniref:uncharacterized protein LOC135153466 n=1 Tax=Lytechinus pictus TaxID=7653 RepID=UPI0030B9DC2B